MVHRVTLFDATTIDQYEPDRSSETGAAAWAILPMIRDGAGRYIDNVATDLRLLEIDGIALPVTVNHAEPNNAYVCSPFCHYATYAKEELRHLPVPIFRAPLSVMISLLERILRWSNIDRTVCVDNWLVSTNLHPELTKTQLAAVTEYLIDRFPRHAVAIRSVDTRGDRQLLDNATVLGYRKIAGRRVYYQDGLALGPYLCTSYRRDSRLFDNSGYEVMQIHAPSEVNVDRLVELYRLLYIDKYSQHNPRFNAGFVRMAIERKLLSFFVLRKDHHVDGVVGFFVRGNVMTTPFFGYDTRLPQETGLYRMLSLLLLNVARERRLLLHASSGAAGFKRARGGVGASEYTLVQARHLTPRRRLGWGLVATLANRIGLPLMKRYKL